MVCARFTPRVSPGMRITTLRPLPPTKVGPRPHAVVVQLRPSQLVPGDGGDSEEAFARSGLDGVCRARNFATLKFRLRVFVSSSGGASDRAGFEPLTRINRAKFREDAGGDISFIARTQSPLDM
jgi:hypothetical protein